MVATPWRRVLTEDVPSSANARPVPSTFVRFAKFGTVGASGVLVNLALLWLFVDTLDWNVYACAALSIEISTLSNYLLNRAWTWRDRDRSWWSLLRYHVITAVGATIQWGVLAAGVLAGFHYALASLAGVAVATAWNFLGNHRVAFVDYTPERRRRDLRIVLYAASLAVHVTLAALLAHDWDTFVFQKTVEEFLGNGVTPYETGAAKPDYVYFGVGLPLQPMWYAYPPLPLLLMSLTYGPVALGAVTAPWAGRLLVKLPFLASNILLAFLAHRLVSTAPGVDPAVAARRARRVEAFLLFNPLFLLITSVWGQFESLLLVFLVLAFLALRTERWGQAGLWWGAAALIKIFPLYLVPVLGVHVLRRGGLRGSTRFFAAGGLLFALVSLPFWLLEPSGYIEQVFRMHANRPPGRFAPLALVYETLIRVSRLSPGSLPDDLYLVRAFSLLSFALTGLALILIALAYAGRPANERNLVFASGLALLAGLLATKVVSEQYAILPIALLAIARWHPQPAVFPDRRVQVWLATATGFVAAAALLDNSTSVLFFLPPDVATRLLGQSSADAFLSLASTLGVSAARLKAILGGIAGVGLLIPLWTSLRLVLPASGEGFRFAAHHVHLAFQRMPVRLRGARVAVLAVFILVLTPAIAVGVLAPKRDVPPTEAGLLDGASLLVHYRTDWVNPTRRPDVAAGQWTHATLTPTSGYYSAVAHKIAEDLVLLDQGGTDGVVFTFHPAHEGQAAAGRLVAEDARMPYALEVNLAHIASDAGGVELTPESAQRARELLDGPGFDFWRGSYHARLAQDGGFLVFLAGADLVHPTFTDAERKHVADLVSDSMGPARTRALETQGATGFWQRAPKTQAELAAPDASMWRKAYHEALLNWWARAFDFEGNATRIDLVVDTGHDVPLAPDAHARVVGRYAPIGSSTPATATGTFDVATVRADPARPDLYAGEWSRAVARRPHALLVSWNDFDQGQGIEPTVQRGAELLRLTERWSPAFRGIGLDASLPPPAWSPTPQASLA